MAKNETRRIPSALLSADREAFDALQGIDNYTPANAAYTTASIKALHDRMDDLQREATRHRPTPTRSATRRLRASGRFTTRCSARRYR